MGIGAQTVRDIIEASRYLVLATADATGRPWSSPVYWVSSPDVQHPRNIAVRPEVAHGGGRWTSVDIRSGSGLLMYRATADSHWILAKDGKPDHRISVPLT